MAVSSLAALPSAHPGAGAGAVLAAANHIRSHTQHAHHVLPFGVAPSSGADDASHDSAMSSSQAVPGGAKRRRVETFYTAQDSISEIKANSVKDVRVVKLNVGGRHYSIELGKLKQHPSTVLGALACEGFWDDEQKRDSPTWIDRDPDAFGAILNFYRCGRMLPPKNLSKSLLRDEMNYFQIPQTSWDFLSEEDQYWVRVAKTVKKNIRNEVLQTALVSMAFERDERLKFFFDIEDKMKAKTSCLDAAHVKCPYCKQDVFYHNSEWLCPVRQHPGRWSRQEQAWECCGSPDIRLQGCESQTHYHCLGFDK